MSSTDAARSQAIQDHQNNAQAQMANEQMIRSAAEREAYNAQLTREREKAERARG